MNPYRESGRLVEEATGSLDRDDRWSDTEFWLVASAWWSSLTFTALAAIEVFHL